MWGRRIGANGAAKPEFLLLLPVAMVVRTTEGDGGDDEEDEDDPAGEDGEDPDATGIGTAKGIGC